MDIAGKLVVVTGADGFIGSHLVEFLIRRGARVRALVLYNSFNDWGWLENVDCRHAVEIVPGDIRDAQQMRSLCRGADVVFHLAALIAIPYSYQAPSSYVDTNVQGTLNVLQGALEAGVQRVIHTSTSEVYGTARFVPISEGHPLQAQSPYSATKIAADALAFSYFSSFDLPLIVARPFNTYGPRQSARAVIPTVITQLLAGSRKLKLGKLSPTRDFNYVADTCAGFVALAECEAAAGETINIGSGTEISVGDTVKLIARLLRADVEIECDEQRLRPAASEVDRLCCDNTRIRELTGWTPGYSLEEGLQETIAWFQQAENLRHYKAEIFNV